MSHPLNYIWCRQQTYRNYADARRSFYKFVCKEEHYGNMRIGSDKWGTVLYREHEKYNFGYSYQRGYPSWNAPRSELRRQWERQFKKRRDEILAQEWKRGEERINAQERVALLGNKKTVKFFRMLTVGKSLK